MFKHLMKVFLEILSAIRLAHQWHTSFKQVYAFVKADHYVQEEIKKRCKLPLDEDGGRKGDL